MSFICQICNENQSKYKCSSCRIPYCSIACYTYHKQKHEEARKENVRDTKEEFPVETPNKEISNDMSPSNFLASNKALKMLFTNYPNLRNRLHAIYSLTLEPPSPGAGESFEKDFKRIKTKSPWTQERADQRALQALHHALTKKDGHGIREFAQLMDTNQVDSSK